MMIVAIGLVTYQQVSRRIRLTRLAQGLSSELSTVQQDVILSEMVRFGGRQAERLITVELDRRAEARKRAEQKLATMDYATEAWVDQEETLFLLQDNLELLTALRRVQRIQDPLKIEARFVKSFEPTPNKLPTLDVTIKNVDYEQTPVWFARGGRYRKGRSTFFRIEAFDENGKQAAAVLNQGVTAAGGLYSISYSHLEHGETWQTQLKMSDFVDIAKPGQYTVQVLYHNAIEIADLEDVTHLIVTKSTPIKLTVQ